MGDFTKLRKLDVICNNSPTLFRMEENIYHYTSIETLALILKSKSIRFNNLENVDDLNETEFSDEFINLSSHTLISCWTKSGEENLAFWNMYTPNMKGVRIKMPKNLFKNYSFTTENVMYAKDNSLILKSLVPKSETFNDKYLIIPFSDYLFDVVYTDDIELLKPRIYHENGEKHVVKIGDIAKYKSTIWQFQQEIRFKLFILPTKDYDGNPLNPLDDFRKIMLKNIRCPLQSYFIKIEDEAFKKMEITLGPKCSMAEELILEALIEKYNSKAVIIKNKYQGSIK